MRRYLATCDDCPAWTYVAATERDAQRRAERHATDSHSDDLREHDIDGFVRANAALAHHFAHRAGLRDGETYADIHADALIGLWDAAKRYDPSQGTFATFAARRITGAIKDGRRQRDPLSRHFRRKGADMPLHLDAPTGEGITLADTLIDPVDDYAALDDANELDARRTAVAALLPSLSPKQRHVLLGRMAGEKFHDLGEQLGVTESRASQLEAEAVRRLRHLLAAA